jgi:uncharacterized protein DUF6968
MNQNQNFPAIAERVFEMVESGRRRELRLRLGAPRYTGENFGCQLQLLGMHNDRVFEIFGEDSLQALQLALKFAGKILRAKQEDGTQITWFKSPNLGLDSF